MKKYLLLLALTMCAISANTQTKLGFSGLVGSSTIFSMRSNEIERSGFNFSPGFTSAIAMSLIQPIGGDFILKADLGYSFLNGPGHIHGYEGVIQVGRIIAPIELHYLKTKALGGFIGIENALNIFHNLDLIGYLTVPYSFSTSIGLTYAPIEKLLTSLYYSVEIKPFAQTKGTYGFFRTEDYPHYHFGIIGFKLSYYPWEI